MTTGGAVLLAFYSDNNDVIIWAWNLMGFPSVMYIIINTNEQAPRFPSISGLTIGKDTKKRHFWLKIANIVISSLIKVLSVGSTMPLLEYFWPSSSCMILTLESLWLKCSSVLPVLLPSFGSNYSFSCHIKNLTNHELLLNRPFLVNFATNQRNLLNLLLMNARKMTKLSKIKKKKFHSPNQSLPLTTF